MIALLRRPVSALGFLLVISALSLILLDRPLIRGDGVAYLAWVDTFVLDGDVNFNNQFERFLPVNTYQITWNHNTQRWVNIFPFGAAFLQAPFYRAADIVFQQGWLNPNPDYFRQMQGVELPYSLMIMAGANLMALIMLALAWDIARLFVSPWLAALLIYALFTGTPLFFYSSVEPLNSHNPGAFAFTVFVYLLIRLTGAFTTRPPLTSIGWWVLLGISAGLTVLSRWQLLVAVAPAWLLLVVERKWRGALIAGIVAAITLLPLPLVWGEMFGRPFVIPYNEVTGEAFLQTTTNEFLNVLRVTWGYSPITLLIVPGLLLLARLSATGRRWALLLGLMFAAQLFVNGAALDWNAGYSFGARRMTELFPVYVIASAAVFGWVEQLTRNQAALRGLVYLLPLLLLAFNWLYLLSFFSYIWTNELSWLGDTSPLNVIQYWLNQPNRFEVIRIIFTTHLGPNAWTHPSP